GHVYAAVFLCGGQPENVVVLVYRTADGAKAVVAVGEDVRQGKFIQPARTRRLNYADVRYVVRSHSVETQSQRGKVSRGVVRGENTVCNGFVGGRTALVSVAFDESFPVPAHLFFEKSYHNN